MREQRPAESGRYRDAGLFLLALTAWVAAESVVGSLLSGAKLGVTATLLLSLGFEAALIVPAVVFIAVKRIRLPELFGRCQVSQVVSAAFVGVLLLPVSVAISAASLSFVTLTGGKPPDAGMTSPVTAPQYLIAFAALAVAAPLVEEPMFRGLVLGGQSSLVRRVPAILFTGLSFAMLHGQTIGLPSLFAGGVVITLLAWHSGSLWPAVAAHASYNSMCLLQIFLAGLFRQRLAADAAALVPPMPVPVVDGSAGLVLGAVVWGFIALPFAASIAVILWSYFKHTPGPARPRPVREQGQRLGFRVTWPWIAAFALLLAYVALDALQVYGIIETTG